MAIKRTILTTVGALVVIAFTITPALAFSPSVHQAPDLQLADLSNTRHSLNDYKGRILVIDFFSADCSECRISAKNVLVPLSNIYRDSVTEVQFVSVEISGASAADTSSHFAQPTGITWPVLVRGGALANLYGSGPTPTLYVIDPSGKIAASMAHPVNVGSLRAVIDGLLLASKTPAPATAPDTTNRATPTPATGTAIPTPVPPATPTPVSPAVTPDPLTSDGSKSAAPPSQSDPPNPALSPAPSHVSKAVQSNETAAAKSLEAPSLGSSANSSDAQGASGEVAAELKHCTAPPAEPMRASAVSPISLLCAPTVPANILAEAATMSAAASTLQGGSGSTACSTPMTACDVSQNGSTSNLTLPTAQTNAASLPTQSVFEFSLLGLGAPTLLVGLLYLLLRRV